MTDDVLTVAEAADRLGMHRTTLARAIRRKDPEALAMGGAVIGNRMVVRRPIFERWLSGDPEPQPATLITSRRIRPIRGDRAS